MMALTCSNCGVRDRALCGSLDDGELAELAALGFERRLERGETLERVGDPPLVCANLTSGVMKIASMTADGSEAIVGLVYPGDFIGRPFAGAAELEVTALTEVTLCVFARGAFERALGDHRRMERLLLERTLAELDAARHWLARLGRASAAVRVAAFLHDMGRRLAVSGCERGAMPGYDRGAMPGYDRGAMPRGAQFDLPLSRGEIADFLGLTIETVSRQITRLRAAGIIELPGGRGIVVRDPAALAAAGK